MVTGRRREDYWRTRGTRSGGGARHKSAPTPYAAPQIAGSGTRVPHGSSPRRRSGGSNRTRSISVPDSNFGASLPLDSLADLRTGRRLRPGPRPANPTGADPPVPPPEYSRRVHRGRLDHLACFTIYAVCVEGRARESRYARRPPENKAHFFRLRRPSFRNGRRPRGPALPNPSGP